MKALLMSLTIGMGFLVAVAQAQAPASAPAGSTGLCKDGTYYSGDSKKGACRGHKGIKEWYAGAAAAASTADAPTKTKSSRTSKSDEASEGAPVATPTGKPADATGLCKDGSYTVGDSKKGACRGHKGVKEWYAAAATAASSQDAPSSKTSKATASASSGATAPSSAPAGSTGLCKDGTYYSGDSRKGACRGHKGVKEWYGAGAAAAATAPPATPPTPSPARKASAATPAPMPVPAPTPTRNSPPAPPETRSAAAGGGAGKVWLNTETKVYHCPNDRYYGKTKQGEYISEADAIAKGAHGSHGKPCAK
jgi:hypothetical protein